MNRKGLVFLLILLLLALLGCGQKAVETKPREGVVYMDPNAAKATAAPAAPKATEAAPAPAEATAEPQPAAEAAEPEPQAPAAVPELYFESKGVRMEPMMEAAPILAALGDPVGSFEADSCAYLGKDKFYYYPGFELTVNEVEGVDRITAVTVADDTVTIPQGLRIYDEEEKLLSLLGGTDENGIY
ncbi:MAG: hypothetical protein IJN47_05860, partial [Clostridia bacterium]|nr:hypothetical protein [Clostridia bacterium]